jgi:RNaseH domain of pPIWI_RE/pPIWI_RE module N-terminal domain
MTEQERLELAAFPFTRELVGVASVYELPIPARRAWLQLQNSYRQHAGSDGNLPHAALTAALRAVTRTQVTLGPVSKDQPPRFLASHQPLQPDDLRDAFTVFEQAILGIPADQIHIVHGSELADIMAGIEPQTGPLSRYVGSYGHQPDAQGWVYDIATWQAASQLAGRSFHVDGLDIRFRMDTSGDLLVWDNDLLWTGSWGARYPTRYAALRLKLQMLTLPHLGLPVLMMDPTVFWLASQLGSSRNAWLAPDDPAAPLLTLRLARARGRPADIDHTTATALTILGKLRGYVPIQPEDRDLSGLPGRLRAVIPHPVRFPIGRGVGMHTLRELAGQVADILGVRPVTAAPVEAHRFKARPRRTLGRDTELLDPGRLPETIAASGSRSLRIVVLYSTPHTRRRVQNLLAYHFDRTDLSVAAISDDRETALVPGSVSVIFRNATDLLAHGPHNRRRQLAGEIPALAPADGVRILALCETEYDPVGWEEQRRKARRDTTVADPDAVDAKHPVNQILARRGVPTQFLAMAPVARVPEQVPEDPADALARAVSKDYPGHGALGDLLRSGGIAHSRIGEALAYGRRGLTTPTAFVGLHLREQKAIAGKRYLIYTMAALMPVTGTAGWQVLGYAWQPHPVTGTTGWMPYADADVAFRAHDLTEGTRATAYDGRLPGVINEALRQLSPRLGSLPYVLFVSGESGRTIWPGLANKHLGREPDPDGTIDGRLALPGPDGFRPAAIVRITSGTSHVPRPVRGVKASPNHADSDHAEDDAAEIVRTTNALYELDLQQRVGRAWLLATVPRQFSGGGRLRRAGSVQSRWQAGPELQRANWYCHTGTEILVLGADEDLASYAVATARLCDHTIAWDSRTRFPVPLHLARQMDADHPEYRRTVDAEYVDDATAEDADAPTEPEEPAGKGYRPAGGALVGTGAGTA